MKKIKKFSLLFLKYKNKNLLIKNFIKLLIFVSLFILIFSMYIYRISKEKINDEYLQTAIKDTQKIAVLTESSLNELFLIAPQIAANDNYKVLLSSENVEMNWENGIGASIKGMIEGYPYLHSCVHSVELYFENSKVKYSTKYPQLPFSYDEPEWYEEYVKMEKNDSEIFFSKYKNAYPYLMTYIFKSSYFGKNGAIAINVNIRELEKIINRGITEEQQFFIVKDNKIIYEKNIMKFMQEMNNHPVLSNIIGDSGSPAQIINLDGKKYSFYTSPSDSFGWEYICVSELVEYNNKMSLESYILRMVLLFAALLAIIVSFVFSVSLYRPVGELVDFVNDTSKKKIANLKGEEIRYIAHKIVDMIGENGELRNELDRYIKALNETEMAALRMQINPHFLFNTLNIINLRLSDSYGFEYDGNEMLEKLSAMLRYSFATLGNTVTVKEDLENLKNYIAILLERYKNCFEAVYEIDPVLNDFKIPILSFQPIIENAVYHGFGKTAKKGSLIKIKGEIAEDKVIFTVVDNGKGITQNKLREIEEQINSNTVISSDHIGLSNVNRRIKLLYGEKFGIFLQSKFGEGTVVIMIFPKE